MGYSYGRNSRGNMALSCDNCGTCDGVRKRVCVYKVLGSTHKTVSGQRHALPYCPAPALCGACLARHGGIRGIHGDSCRDGAAASQARYDAEQAALDAGDMLVSAAWGDWADGVPSGMVKVLFAGRDGAELTALVLKADYEPGTKRRLSDYPGALTGLEGEPIEDVA